MRTREQLDREYDTLVTDSFANYTESKYSVDMLNESITNFFVGIQKEAWNAAIGEVIKEIDDYFEECGTVYKKDLVNKIVNNTRKL